MASGEMAGNNCKRLDDSSNRTDGSRSGAWEDFHLHLHILRPGGTWLGLSFGVLISFWRNCRGGFQLINARDTKCSQLKRRWTAVAAPLSRSSDSRLQIAAALLSTKGSVAAQTDPPPPTPTSCVWYKPRAHSFQGRGTKIGNSRARWHYLFLLFFINWFLFIA